MLQLRYSRARAPHEYVTLMGEPEAISDLYWQLTRNHHATDGTAIGEVRVFNLQGEDVTATVLSSPRAGMAPMCTVQR